MDFGRDVETRIPMADSPPSQEVLGKAGCRAPGDGSSRSGCSGLCKAHAGFWTRPRPPQHLPGRLDTHILFQGHDHSHNQRAFLFYSVSESSDHRNSAGVSLFFRTVSPKITVHRTPPSLCLWPEPRKGVPRSKGPKHLPEEKESRAGRLILQILFSMSWGFRALKENHPSRCCPHTPGCQFRGHNSGGREKALGKASSTALTPTLEKSLL